MFSTVFYNTFLGTPKTRFIQVRIIFLDALLPWLIVHAIFKFSFFNFLIF